MMKKIMMKFGLFTFLFLVLQNCSTNNANKANKYTGSGIKPNKNFNHAKVYKIYKYARALDKNNQLRNAERQYKKFLLLNSQGNENYFQQTAKNAQFFLAENLFAQKKLEKAFYAYDKFIKQYPQSHLFSQSIGKQYLIAELISKNINKKKLLIISKYTKASVIKMFKKIAENAPYKIQAQKALFQTALITRSSGNPVKAIEIFKEIIKKYPHSITAKDAQLQIASMLDKNVRKGNKDAYNVKLAKDAYHDYLLAFPRGEYRQLASKKIKELSITEVKKNLEIARFYAKQFKISSAKIYYNEVLKSRHKKLADQARNELKKLNSLKKTLKKKSN